MPKKTSQNVSTLGVRSHADGVDNRNSAGGWRLAVLTKHDGVTNTVIIAQLVTIGTTGEIHLNMHADPLSLTVTNNSPEVRINLSSLNYQMVSFLTVPEVSQKFGSRGGVEMTMPTGKTFTQISTEDFYIDFGCTFQSDTKSFSKATVRDFFCFNQATREQSTRLSSFS